MDIVFNKGSASNTWEPHPWDANGFKVRKQKANFLKCIEKPIHWQRFSVKKFEKDGLWGKDAKVFREFDLEYIAEVGDCKYMLMENCWFGFPDPPQWRLAFSENDDLRKWKECGYFYDMPKAWIFLGGEHPVPPELKVSTKMTDD